MITVTCPCGQRLRAAADFAGERIDCPYCGRTLDVPNVDPPEVPEPEFQRPDHSASSHAARPRSDVGATLIDGLSLLSAILGVVATASYGAGWPILCAGVGGFGIVPSVLGLLIAWRSNPKATAAPSIGLIFCAAIAALALLRPGLSGPGRVRPVGPRAGSEGTPPGSGSRPGRPGPSPTSASNWTPASEPARQGDFQVRIVSASILRPRVREIFTDEVSSWKDPVLMVRIEVKNLGALEAVSYRNAVPRVADNLGHQLREINLGTSVLLDRSLGDRKVYPGKVLSDTMMFEPPPEEIEYIDLELPGEVVGLSAPFRFRIPSPMVER